MGARFALKSKGQVPQVRNGGQGKGGKENKVAKAGNGAKGGQESARGKGNKGPIEGRGTTGAKGMSGYSKRGEGGKR